MQSAKAVAEILHERGLKGLPIQRLYRQLFNPNLYLQAYAKIYSNKGAMTSGVTDETVDDMSLQKIQGIINELKLEKYQWSPVRRVHIPKKQGGKRPLGLPTWSDKLLQEVIRLLLETYYDPTFSNHSHGFRTGRGCHTAFLEIHRTWKGTKWFIEGDIKGCFDNIDHETLLKILAERIHDGRFLELIRKLLKAGYMEDWQYGLTLSGTPQGGIVSPLLANIYLDKLDKFIEDSSSSEYNKGKLRKHNPAYKKLQRRIEKLRKNGVPENHPEMKELIKQRRKLPSKDPNDPKYRRLRFVRYADDFLLAFVGPKAEAFEIKKKLKTFLQKELKLELSEEKTLITHARTGKARFLGYNVNIAYVDDRLVRAGKWMVKTRTVNAKPYFTIPRETIHAKRNEYMSKGKPIQRGWLVPETAYTIIQTYQSEYRGFVQYYKFAHNQDALNKLKTAMERSLTATLADKFRTTRRRICKRYGTEYKHPNGKTYKVLEVRIRRKNKKDLVARWGAIPLIRDERAVIRDPFRVFWVRSGIELLQRLLADKCEICETTENIRIHHVHALKDLKGKERWERAMLARRRKTLVVCHECHCNIHAGRDPYSHSSRLKNSTGEPDEGKLSRPVREEVVGKATI